MSETMKIPKLFYNQMVAHAKSMAPIESCGYLGGLDGEVRSFYPMVNVDNSEEHFSFDPKEQFQVVKEARKKGEKLMGVYHSHPETPARLSEEDIKLFNDPEPIYVIVSLKDKTADVAGFKVEKPSDTEINITRVNLEVIKENA